VPAAAMSAHGRLMKQSDLPDTVYAFPKQRKEPLTDARHVRNAVARFDQVMDVSAAERAQAFANIQKGQSTMVSISRRARGAISVFIPNATARKPPPGALPRAAAAAAEARLDTRTLRAAGSLPGCGRLKPREPA